MEISKEGSTQSADIDVTQRAIALLWKEALQMTDLPAADDNFFSLGGDSMTMTVLEFRIAEELSVGLNPGTLLSAPTLRELSAAVDEARANRAATTV